MENNYLKIRNVGSIVIVGDVPEPEKDYVVAIRCALSAITENIEDKDDPRRTYIMKYISTENVSEIGTSRKIEVVKGKTKSQILRFVLEDLADNLGKDRDKFYNEKMDRIIEHFKGNLTF